MSTKVNHSPSFTTDSKLDREIKDALIYDTIMLLNIGVSDKRRCIDEERKRVRERLFLRQGRRETKFVNFVFPPLNDFYNFLYLKRRTRRYSTTMVDIN